MAARGSAGKRGGRAANGRLSRSWYNRWSARMSGSGARVGTGVQKVDVRCVRSVRGEDPQSSGPALSCFVSFARVWGDGVQWRRIVWSRAGAVCVCLCECVRGVCVCDATGVVGRRAFMCMLLISCCFFIRSE